MNTHRIARALLRKVAPADPSKYLAIEEMESLAPRVRQFERRAVLIVLVFVVGLAILVGSLLWPIRRARDLPAIDPVYDDFRTRIMLCYGFGFFVAMCLSYIPWRFLLTIAWGPETPLYFRYKATKNGYDEQRALPWAMMPMFLIVLFFGIAAWNQGEVVDANGIRFTSGLFGTHSQAYSSVRSINVFEQLTAPIGIRDVPNLQVTFEVGPPFTLQPNKGDLTPERLDKIAVYIGARSGVAVQRGGCRP